MGSNTGSTSACLQYPKYYLQQGMKHNPRQNRQMQQRERLDSVMVCNLPPRLVPTKCQQLTLKQQPLRYPNSTSSMATTKKNPLAPFPPCRLNLIGIFYYFTLPFVFAAPYGDTPESTRFRKPMVSQHPSHAHLGFGPWHNYITTIGITRLPSVYLTTT